MKTILSTLLSIYLVNTPVHVADKIRIAIPEPNAAYLMFPLAQKMGFFANRGVAAEVILMRGVLTVPALNDGDVDYLTAVAIGVRGAVAGLPLKTVACYLPKSSLMVVSRAEINSVQELKGKTVAVSSFASTNSGALQLIAKHFGLNPEKEIKMLPVGGNESRLAALRQGLVAAMVVPPPWDFHAKKLGFHVIARSYEIFSYPQIGLIVNESKIKQRPEEIKRLTKGGIEANRYIRSNREGTVQFLMEWMQIDKDVAVATYEAYLPALSEDGNCPEDGVRFVIEEAKKVAKVSRDVPVDKVMDLRILGEA